MKWIKGQYNSLSCYVNPIKLDVFPHDNGFLCICDFGDKSETFRVDGTEDGPALEADAMAAAERWARQQVGALFEELVLDAKREVG